MEGNHNDNTHTDMRLTCIQENACQLVYKHPRRPTHKKKENTCQGSTGVHGGSSDAFRYNKEIRTFTKPDAMRSMIFPKPEKQNEKKKQWKG